MTVGEFFAATAAVQLLFLGLDLADRYTTRAERYEGERLRGGSLLFLVGIVVLFLAIQLAGLALIPRVDALVDRTRTLVAPNTMPAPAPSGWRLVLVGVVLFHVAGFVDSAWGHP